MPRAARFTSKLITSRRLSSREPRTQEGSSAGHRPGGKKKYTSLRQGGLSLTNSRGRHLAWDDFIRLNRPVEVELSEPALLVILLALVGFFFHLEPPKGVPEGSPLAHA